MPSCESGRKQSRWMAVRLAGSRRPGLQPMARDLGDLSLEEEAKAHPRHSDPGARLRECVRLVNAVEGPDAPRATRAPDDLEVPVRR